jgi:hypothetical protein
LNFLDKFLKKETQIPNFIKILLVGAELFHADGRIDMTKQIVAFRSFANAPKNLLTDSFLPVTRLRRLPVKPTK